MEIEQIQSPIKKKEYKNKTTQNAQHKWQQSFETKVGETDGKSVKKGLIIDNNKL